MHTESCFTCIFVNLIGIFGSLPEQIVFFAVFQVKADSKACGIICFPSFEGTIKQKQIGSNLIQGELTSKNTHKRKVLFQVVNSSAVVASTIWIPSPHATATFNIRGLDSDSECCLTVELITVLETISFKSTAARNYRCN